MNRRHLIQDSIDAREIRAPAFNLCSTEFVGNSINFLFIKNNPNKIKIRVRIVPLHKGNV